MIKLDHLKQIYFLGIGGIGMSALARYFAELNYEVAGYDKSSSAITRSLEQASCTVFNKDVIASIPSSFNNPNRVLIVYTPAISQHSTLFKYFLL